MSGPTDDETPDEGGGPKNSQSASVGKRPSPQEMFPPEEEEERPDIFDVEVRRSHRSHKEQVEAFARLAKDLIELTSQVLVGLDLDPELQEAVVGCRSLRKNARIREQRRIATMLRHTDARALRDRLDEISSGDRAKVNREKQREKWRERLLEGGDAALSEFIQTYPSADRQRLRQLVRSAGKDRTKGKAVHAYRTLLREIRALDEADPS